MKLRNLVIRSLTEASGRGVFVTTVGTLYMENVTLERFSYGLRVTGPGLVTLRDVVVKSNSAGIAMAQAGGAEQVLSMDRTMLHDNQVGLSGSTSSTTGFLKVAIEGSVFDGPGHIGGGSASFSGAVASAAPIRVSISRTKFVGRSVDVGIAVGAGGAQTVVTLSECHFVGYPVSVTATSNSPSGVGVIRSRGNNTLIEGALGTVTTIGGL